MQNAHLRLGRLEYIKPAISSKSTPTHVTITMDRVIVEPACDEKQAPRCHLLSVFGGEQEIAAIHAAIAEQANFRIAGPDLSPMIISLGERAHTSRGLIQAPGRRQPVRHLVSVSQDLFETQAGANAQADRTVVYSADPEFLVYRLGVRFGIPLLPCWSEWIAADLTRQNRVHPLLGLGCNPVLVKSSKQELVNLIAGAVKRGVLSIPDKPSIQWSVPQAFA
ncbi:MAG TPA: hypothetical protein VH477_21475 [Bryobacteraceae bacterium]|jgi:hypothetical protein